MRRRPPSATAALGLLIALPTTGCCGLASLFCGPDRSRWVSVGYDTPVAALSTFMEAVRRDNARIVCESLSDGFRARLGLPGCLEGALAWDRIRQQTPGVHLLGEAEIGEPRELASGRVEYVLEVAGYRLRAVVARHPFVGVRYRVDDTIEPQEDYVEALTDYVILGHQEFDSTVDLRIPGLDLPPGLTAGDVETVIASHYWKVDDLVELTDS